MIKLLEAFSTGAYVTSAYGRFYENFNGVPGARTNDYYIAWTDSGYVQVEYRSRHRLAYDGQDVETFGPWSAWTKLYTSTYTPSTVVKLDSSTSVNMYATKLPHTSSDFTGSYDAMVYQIRIRSCDSSGANTKPWTTTDVPFYYLPDFALVSCDLNPDTLEIDIKVAPGGLDGNNDPVQIRPIKFINLDSVTDSNGDVKQDRAMTRREVSSFVYDANGYVHLTVPASSSGLVLDAVSARLYIVHSDGENDGRLKACTVTIPTASAYLKEPVATFLETDSGLQITVEHGTASGQVVAYESVGVAYSWNDARGKLMAGYIELEQAPTDWVGEIPAPPFGQRVTAVVTVNGTKVVPIYRTKTFTHDMALSKWFVLSYGSEVVWLGYELSLSRTLDNSMEVVNLASGRSVSRHGYADQGKMNLSGTILDAAARGSLSSIWLPDVETLSDAHDWDFRTPNGERYRVAIGGFSERAERPGIVELTVNMYEVS